MSTKTLIERAQAAKEEIIERGILSLYTEAGEDGVFFPATQCETAWARYWTEEQYTWDEAIADMPADEIMGGNATAILDRAFDALIDAARDIGDADLTESVVAAARRSLEDADDATRQSACDAVVFEDLDGDALEYLRGDLDETELDEATVAKLEKMAS